MKPSPRHTPSSLLQLQTYSAATGVKSAARCRRMKLALGPRCNQLRQGSAVNYVYYSAKRTDMEPRDAGQQDLHHGTRRRLMLIRQVPPHGMPSSSSRSRRPNPDPSEPRDIRTNV